MIPSKEAAVWSRQGKELISGGWHCQTGLGAQEAAHFICHAEDLELLKKKKNCPKLRNLAERKTVDSFRFRLQHYLPGPPKDDLILCGIGPLILLHTDLG